MSVEGGPSGGGSGGGPSGGIGGGVGAVAGVGSGIEGGGLAGPIVNEGPVGLAALKLTVPFRETRFNESLSVPDVLAEAQFIITEAQKPAVQQSVPAEMDQCMASIILSSRRMSGSNSNRELFNWIPAFAGMTEVVKPTVIPRVEPLVVPVSPMLFPAVEPATEPVVGSSTQTENIVSSKAAATILVQPALEEQEVEEVVTEEVVKQDQKEALEEEEIMERKPYLEDQEVSLVRKQEIREAIVKAKVEADRLGLKKITGWLVAKFLPAEHEGNRSQIVKKSGPDGSYQETVETIAQVGELESEGKALERLDGVVAEKKPVKYGKGGIPVTESDVARVFKYRFVKPAQPHTEVIRRVIKKSSILSGQSRGADTIPPRGWMKDGREETRKETSLEELSPALAEVFPKH